MNFLKEIEKLAIDIAGASFRTEKDRNIDIIKKRFALEGNDFYTLKEIGLYYEIEGERVRQIEATALRNLKTVLAGDVLKGGVYASDAFLLEFEQLKLEIYELDNIIIEKDVTESLCVKYGIEKNSESLKLVPLLLEILGYFKLPNTISGYSGEIYNCWYLGDVFDRKSVESVFKSLNKYKKKAEKVKIFNLVVDANRACGEKVNKELLHLLLKACPDYQKVDEESIEVRFESLPSLAEKAFRVLEYFNEATHYKDILREINFRLSSKGLDNIATDVSLKNQMISDKRFIAIGKSGYWVLKSWDSISTKPITELMELYFHKENSTKTVDQIFDFVSSKRPGVSRQSIVTYLYDKPQFIRSGNGQYALAAWGGKTETKAKVTSRQASLNIKEAAEEIFSIEDTISNSKLVQLIYVKCGISQATIRKAIKSCDEIVVLSTSGKSNILKCIDLRLSSLLTEVPKKLLRERIQEEVVNVMMLRNGDKIIKIDLYKEVSKKVDCIRPTFYRYLSEMTNIKQYMHKNKYYCEMEIEKNSSSSISYLDLSPLDLCSNLEVIENVVKATDKLNEKDVDIGLFELGRTFENILKQYLEQSKINNDFPVFTKDLARLVSMIACIERNKESIPVKLKNHHLTLLREDRNLRAHGKMPTKQDRLVILAKAPFVVEMYIDYIVEFSKLISTSAPKEA